MSRLWYEESIKQIFGTYERGTLQRCSKSAAQRATYAPVWVPFSPQYVCQQGWQEGFCPGAWVGMQGLPITGRCLGSRTAALVARRRCRATVRKCQTLQTSTESASPACVDMLAWHGIMCLYLSVPELDA